MKKQISKKREYTSELRVFNEICRNVREYSDAAHLDVKTKLFALGKFETLMKKLNFNSFNDKKKTILLRGLEGKMRSQALPETNPLHLRRGKAVDARITPHYVIPEEVDYLAIICLQMLPGVLDGNGVVEARKLYNQIKECEPERGRIVTIEHKGPKKSVPLPFTVTDPTSGLTVAGDLLPKGIIVVDFGRTRNL